MSPNFFAMKRAPGGERARQDRLTAGAALGLGLDIAVGMVVFVLGGWWLDRRRETGSFWTLFGLVLGLAYAAYEVWKFARILDPDRNRKEPPP